MLQCECKDKIWTGNTSLYFALFALTRVASSTDSFETQMEGMSIKVIVSVSVSWIWTSLFGSTSCWTFGRCDIPGSGTTESFKTDEPSLTSNVIVHVRLKHMYFHYKIYNTLLITP